MIESAVGDAIQNFANAVMEMVGTAVSSLGTVWLYIGTPNLTDGSGGSSIQPGTTPPGTSGLVTALGYVTWIGLALAGIAVVLLGVRIAASLRRGEGALNIGRLGLVAGGVVIISGAGSLVAGLLPTGPHGAGGATLFIQSGLWWYMGGLAVLSVIIGGIRMVWENRADPGFDVIKSLFTLLVVAGAGVVFTQLFITAADTFSVWFLQQSLKCNVGTDQACFGKNITTLLVLGANPATGGSLGAMLVIILGIIASLAAFVQIVLMVLRSGALVILAGVLPISAAATNTEMGKTWFRRCIAWTVAFLLYKPAAAIVYATAFQLVGSDIFKNDDALVSILVGLMLMVMAIVALPALMRFVTPLVSSTTSGAAGGAMAAGAMAALPTGAAEVGQLVAGHGSNAANTTTSTQPSGASPSGGGNGQGPAGSNGQSAPSGADGPGGAPGANGHGTQGAPGAGSAGANGSSGASSAAGGGTQAAAQAAQSGGSAGAASGAAGGTAAAGAAGGPIGMAAAEGASKVSEVGHAAANAARAASQDVTGEGDGPSGNG
ncbi:MAG: hypothetical protein L0H41_09660 [Microlunatus sp.]|nr:hypothetical protein [Microlunatus sp.]